MITLLGNCQLDRLKLILSINGIEDYEYFSNTERLDPNINIEQVLHRISESQLVITQPILNPSNPLNIEKIKKISPSTVVVPYIFIDGFFSLSSADINYRHIYGEEYVNDMLTSEGFGYTIELFKNGNIDFHNKERLDLSIQELQARESYCNISISDYIAENIASELLLVTHNHPAPHLFDVFCSRLFSFLDWQYTPLAQLRQRDAIEYVFRPWKSVFSPYDAGVWGTRFPYDMHWFTTGFDLLKQLDQRLNQTAEPVIDPPVLPASGQLSQSNPNIVVQPQVDTLQEQPKVSSLPHFSDRRQVESFSTSRLRRILAYLWGLNRLFVATVLLPLLAAIFFFTILASDVYLSESRFVVRSPDRQTPTSSLGLLLRGSGFSRSQDDSYTVQEFMLSRDALRQLIEKLSIKAQYTSPSIDIFSRFAGLNPDDSFEEFFRYYTKRIVEIKLDGTSSITTLTVRAFSAEDAFRVNQQLLEMSEALVNQLNLRGREDMIRFAASEVEAAEKKAKTAAMALASYRDEKGVIDPERQSSIQLQQIAKLQDELIATKAQLSQLQTFTAQNPQIPALQQRVLNLRQQIDTETNRVAGGNRSLANKAAEFQRLALEREFADRQLAGALASLEQARNEAQRKQLYLERIAQPSMPDSAMEPHRFRSILATLLLGLVAWGILTMLVAGIREHQD